jgi:hypothetical protein
MGVHGLHKVKDFSCLDQFFAVAFAQLTYREPLRDIEGNLRAQAHRLYHMGFRYAECSSLPIKIGLSAVCFDSRNCRTNMRNFSQFVVIHQIQRLSRSRRTAFNTDQTCIARIVFNQRRNSDTLANRLENAENGRGPKGKAFSAQCAHPLFVRQALTSVQPAAASKASRRRPVVEVERPSLYLYFRCDLRCRPSMVISSSWAAGPSSAPDIMEV